MWGNIMNTTFRFVSLGLATILSTLVGCAAPAGDSDDVGGGAGAASAAPAAPKVEIVEMKVTKKATDTSFSDTMTECEISGNYAKVSGLANAAAQAKLNEALQPEELRSLEKDGCEQPFTFESSTKVILESPVVLSVERAGNDYYAGAAHPNAYISVDSFDLQTGQKLAIKDVFSDPSGKQLAHEVVAVLQSGNAEQKELAEMIGEQIVENPEWMSFALTRDGVQIFLTPYMSHASFALATEPVTLRYSDLRDALSGASPAASLWANAH